MPAPKGHPRYGGRKKGTPNKRSLAALEIFEANDFDPVQKLIDIYNATDDESIRLSASTALLPYRHSKPTTQITGEIEVKTDEKWKPDLKRVCDLMTERKRGDK